jgi:hypothetical protein
MLVKSSKSRFAAMALMALGVSTFMGTSAALATGVDVSGRVGENSNFFDTPGCEATPSTVTAPPVVDFQTVPKGTIGLEILTPIVTQGKTNACADKTSSVTASIGTFTGEADTNVTEANRVGVTIGNLTSGAFPISANVPRGAATGAFGATVTLTLTD